MAPPIPSNSAFHLSPPVSDELLNSSTVDSHTGANPTENAIKSIVNQMLDGCNTPFHVDPYDTDLHSLCIQEIQATGYPFGPAPDEIPLVYLHTGVRISGKCYAHLAVRYQVYAAIFTGIAAWVDDTYSEDPTPLEPFYERFMSGERQESKGLDAAARIFKDLAVVYGQGSVQSDVILMATLKFITGIRLENEARNCKVNSNSRSFASYVRWFTGAAEVYAMFSFDPSVPVSRYMQAIPDLCLFINYYNDVLSFYKEEMAGDTHTYIVLEATVQKKDKLVVLQEVANKVIMCCQRLDDFFRDDEEGRLALDNLKMGYLSFHTSDERRYRLQSLFST